MTLYQIALRNLNRRKGKILFMLAGLVLGVAAVVSIYSIVSSMRADIQKQLAELGANIVIAADTGELTFQYGGIVIPELIYDAARLSEADLETIFTIPGAQAILAVSPRLMGTLSAGHRPVVVAGVDLPAEFAVKPWLRFFDGSVDTASAEPDSDMEMEMEYRPLDLSRTENVPGLRDDQVVLGFQAAGLLKAQEGGAVELGGKTYTVLAVLEEGGMAEDSQILMNLAEAQAVLERPGELTVIEIASDFSRVPEEMLLLQLRDTLPHAGVTGVRQAVMGRDELLSSLSRFGIFAGSLIFFTGTLVVILTMSAAVRERTREIGIFRAIGFRGSHIFKIIVTEGLSVSAVGGLIGYHAGIAAARAVGPLLTGASTAVAWQPAVLLLAIAATAIAGGLASTFPALRAARLDPVEALRFI